MITQLQRQRLIAIKEENGEPAYNIHRVLQEMIQYDLDVYSFADAFRKAVRQIHDQINTPFFEQRAWPELWELSRLPRRTKASAPTH